MTGPAVDTLPVVDLSRFRAEPEERARSGPNCAPPPARSASPT
ncbi:hypothetical protein [Pseudonocardia sp. NPDC049154]